MGFFYVLQDDEITELAGVRHGVFYDIESQVEAQRKALGIVEEELVIKLGLSLRLGWGTTTASIMCCKLVYPENSEPWDLPILGRIKGVDEPEIPEPKDNPVVQVILSKASKFAKFTDVKCGIGFDGPITTAPLCRGIDQFCIDVFRALKLSRKLIEKVTLAAIVDQVS